MQSEWATQREAAIIKPCMHLQHGSIYNLLVSLQLIQSQYYMALTLLQRVISQHTAVRLDFPIDISSLKEFTQWNILIEVVFTSHPKCVCFCLTFKSFQTRDFPDDISTCAVIANSYDWLMYMSRSRWQIISSLPWLSNPIYRFS